VWTLQLVADVSLEQGLIGERVTDETIRNVLKRLGVNWKRAKKWITSPDPEYARKKQSRPADEACTKPARVGAGFRGRVVVQPV